MLQDSQTVNILIAEAWSRYPLSLIDIYLLHLNILLVKLMIPSDCCILDTAGFTLRRRAHNCYLSVDRFLGNEMRLLALNLDLALLLDVSCNLVLLAAL